MSGVEAGDGIEPSHGAFAEPGLTTWLPRHESHLTISNYAQNGQGHNEVH